MRHGREGNCTVAIVNAVSPTPASLLDSLVSDMQLVRLFMHVDVLRELALSTAVFLELLYSSTVDKILDVKQIAALATLTASQIYSHMQPLPLANLGSKYITPASGTSAATEAAAVPLFPRDVQHGTNAETRGVWACLRFWILLSASPRGIPAIG